MCKNHDKIKMGYDNTAMTHNNMAAVSLKPIFAPKYSNRTVKCSHY